jgi:hypothetical protein
MSKSVYNRAFEIAHSTGIENQLLRTPWGTSETSKWADDGIVWVTTPSHGGYLLSRERFMSMPDTLKAFTFVGTGAPQAFEEDCAWCAVLLAWPSLFGASQLFHAEQCAKQCNPTEYAKWVDAGRPTADLDWDVHVTADEIRAMVREQEYDLTPAQAQDAARRISSALLALIAKHADEIAEAQVALAAHA